MREYTLTHLTDATLLRDLTTLVSGDRETTTLILAHIAEVDARRAYAGAGYPSLFAYCVEELHYSEDAAYKRIQAARAARLFPALFEAVADGRLHLTAVCMLAPHLNPRNLHQLIRAATHRKKQEIEVWLAVRFGSTVNSASVSSIKPLVTRGHGMARGPELALERVPSNGPEDTLEKNGCRPAADEANQSAGMGSQLAPEQVAVGRGELALEQVADDARREPERYLIRVTIDRNTHNKLRYAQELLSHAVPSGDVAQVLDRALDALITRLERRKLGAVRSTVVSANPDLNPASKSGAACRRARARRTTTRSIPAHVRRAVWDRDGGRCTFVASGGHRCESRRFIEFDHVKAFARGGAATVEGMRLRCRAHNQFGAERVFGGEFMRMKREEARLARREAAKRRLTIAQKEAEERGAAARKEQAKDLEAGLRGLGCRVDEARRAAEYAMTIESASFEERLRMALAFRSRRMVIRSDSRDACEVRERRARYGPRASERRAPRSPRLYTGNESRFGTTDTVSGLERPSASMAHPAYAIIAPLSRQSGGEGKSAGMPRDAARAVASRRSRVLHAHPPAIASARAG